MNYIDIIHLIIVLVIVLIPFYPLNILKYAIYVPMILASIWLFFGNCPLTIATKNNGHGHSIFRYFFLLNLQLKCTKHTFGKKS